MNLVKEAAPSTRPPGSSSDERTVLSVVIPALNEERGIEDIVLRVKAVEWELRKAGVERTEVLVVDDGSADRTAEIVERIPGVRLVRHSKNQGYGAAIKTGFSRGSGELLAFLDADGTYPPEQLPLLCRAVLEQNADVAVGSRRSGTDSQMPALRRLGNLLWSNLVTIIGSRRCADPASGMRVLRRSVLPQLYPLPDGLNFTPVMSTRAVHEELRVVELPIPYRERVGRSKLSIVHDGSRFLKTILSTALEYNPSKVLGLVSVTLFLTALLIGLVVGGMRLAGIASLGIWGAFSVFAMLVLAVGGVSIYSLGLTSNVLVSLFHRRPMRQGLFGGSALERSLERHFGWLGTGSITLGLVLLGVSLIMGGGWDLARIWFWFLGSALYVLVGLQLVIFWIVARVLEKLAERETVIDRELGTEGSDEESAAAIARSRRLWSSGFPHEAASPQR